MYDIGLEFGVLKCEENIRCKHTLKYMQFLVAIGVNFVCFSVRILLCRMILTNWRFSCWLWKKG